VPRYPYSAPPLAAAAARLTKRPWRLILLGAAATLVGVLGYQWRAAIKRNRSVPDEPFQIAGNLYYVGATGVTAHVTAGHTPGCTSWSFPVRHGDRELLAVSICSLTLLPFMSLVEPESYPGIRSDFERSFNTLRSLPADIFLASHGSFFGMDGKRRARADAKDPAEPFIDRDGYRRYIDNAEKRFREELAEQQRP
jgi:glyoxylase-like metal-dependent hydrolase (beta-lactamase superfamily II)